VERGEFYDISVTLGAESVEYPGDAPFRRDLAASIGEGDGFELSSLRMSAHAGTHIDAPAHFIEGGKRIEEYDVSAFILGALVIETFGREAIEPSEVAAAGLERGMAALFKTENSRSGLSVAGGFSKDYVSLSARSADVLVGAGAGMVGIDYASVDAPDAENFPVHKRLLSGGALILEGINLAEVEPGRYTLICPPLKVAGEAAPARALLMR